MMHKSQHFAADFDAEVEAIVARARPLPTLPTVPAPGGTVGRIGTVGTGPGAETDPVTVALTVFPGARVVERRRLRGDWPSGPELTEAEVLAAEDARRILRAADVPLDRFEALLDRWQERAAIIEEGCGVLRPAAEALADHDLARDPRAPEAWA